MLRRLCLACVRWIVSPFALRLAACACAACCLATSCVQATALLGASLPATLALVAALSIGFAMGAGPARWLGRIRIAGISAGTVLYFGLAAWIVLSPSVVQMVDAIISRPDVVSLASPARNSVVLLFCCLALVGAPAFLTAVLAGDPDHRQSWGQRPVASSFLAAAAGLAVWMLGIAQVVGPYYFALIAAGLGLAASALRGYRLWAAEARAELSENQNGNGLGESSPAAGPEEAAIDVRSRRSGRQVLPQVETAPAFPALWRLAADGVLAVGLGGSLAAMGRFLEQVLPGTVYLACSEAIGLCLGIGAGVLLAGWLAERATRMERARVVTIGAAALLGPVLVAGFPWLFELALWLYAYVGSATLIVAARGALAALCVFPAGAAAAICLLPAPGERNPGPRPGLPAMLTLGVLGYAVASAWALRRFPLEDVVVGCSWSLAASAAPLAIWRPAGLLTGTIRKAVAAAVVAVICIAPAWRHNFDPQLAGKLLFNSTAAYGYRAGLSPAALIGIDDGRHIASSLGQRGIYTVWRFGGHQLQIRENGIPCGVVCTDVKTFPRFLPDVMQSVLPLAMHGRVERMLQLGLGSSEGLAVALAFPVPEIVCLETDASLVRLVQNVVSADSGANPLDDDRLVLQACEPALGLAGTEGRFDVIVSCPPNVALTRAQPYFTAEFYRRVAQKLSPEGIFSQRLQHVDIGPRPVRSIVATLRSVFREVIAVEVAAGDMVLTATNGDAGLIRPELSARFELPHVRRVLAESGIDWPVAMNLDAVSDTGLGKFAADAPQAINSAAGGRLALALPREVVRWAPKQQELFEALGRLKGRFLDWIGEEAQSQVLVRRLSEVQGQLDLMTKYSDQYWAYRASLRSQVKDKSRSQIRQVSATDDSRQLHPEDQRRLQYFKALGEATRTHRAADIDRLVRFAEPYDPLISYFVHEEAAEMYSRSPERDCVKELRHRLYATFFSSPRDASLRNVVGALTLLREHPEAEPDARARWDDLNALLQALKLRWEARAGIPPTNIKEAINDIDTTIVATEQAVRLLDRLTAEAGLPESLWKARRTVLEKMLIRPVKAYEAELMPHLNRRQTDGGDREPQEGKKKK